jgi:hypothetical protein
MNRAERRAHSTHSIARNRSRNTAPLAVEVHIERLVLHGFPAGLPGQLGHVVQSELSEIFSTRGLPLEMSAAGDIARIDRGSCPLNSSATPASLGARIAASIYGDSKP